MLEMRNHNSEWVEVELGEVAINSTAATLEPEKEGFERYIIGKHIPGDGSAITTWNEVGDGEFGSRIRTIIQSGDIVCTTRGPKLRVAVATFDCLSAHTNFILRTNDQSILMQECLQAIICSEEFQEHLRRNFRGSTNLFVNWSDAAKFKFLLPPIQEQARLVEVLKSSSDSIKSLFDLACHTEALLESLLLETLEIRGVARPESHKCRFESKAGEEIYTAKSGNGEPTFHDDGDTLFFKVADFNRNIDHRSLRAAEKRFNRHQNPSIRVFPPGTVVFPKRGASIFLNKIGILSHPAALDPNLMALEPDQELTTSEFLMWFFKGVGLWRFADTTSVPQLNHKHLKPVRVPLPSLPEQTALTAQLSQIADALAHTRKRLEQAQATHIRIREKALEPTRVTA